MLKLEKSTQQNSNRCNCIKDIDYTVNFNLINFPAFLFEYQDKFMKNKSG